MNNNIDIIDTTFNMLFIMLNYIKTFLRNEKWFVYGDFARDCILYNHIKESDDKKIIELLSNKFNNSNNNYLNIFIYKRTKFNYYNFLNLIISEIKEYLKNNNILIDYISYEIGIGICFINFNYNKKKYGFKFLDKYINYFDNSIDTIIFKNGNFNELKNLNYKSIQEIKNELLSGEIIISKYYIENINIFYNLDNLKFLDKMKRKYKYKIKNENDIRFNSIINIFPNDYNLLDKINQDGNIDELIDKYLLFDNKIGYKYRYSDEYQYYIKKNINEDLTLSKIINIYPLCIKNIITNLYPNVLSTEYNSSIKDLEPINKKIIINAIKYLYCSNFKSEINTCLCSKNQEHIIYNDRYLSNKEYIYGICIKCSMEFKKELPPLNIFKNINKLCDIDIITL